jgi:glycosyltransferase involved in cell wall biosynthesis
VRIALVVTGGVDRSGREKVIPALVWLIERLAVRHEVFVYALRYHDHPCTYPLRGATVHDLGRPAGALAQYTRLVARLRRDGPFDVVHGYWALPAGLAAAAAARRLGIPCVVTADSGEFSAIPEIGYGNQLRWRQRLAVRAALRMATRVTVCSRYMERLARRHGCVPEVIPMGVDRTVFAGGPERAAPRISGGAPRIPGAAAQAPRWQLLHVAHLNPVKDQPTLLRAFRAVVDRIGDAHLDIAGEDTMNGTIQALARDLRLESHVTFHGALPGDRLTTLYRNAHLLLLSSRHEAAGVVLLEAAASGVPTVGSAVGYLADWAPERAVAVAPHDPPALAEAVLALLANPAERARLAASAREWALAHDADWTARAFERLYASM